LVLRPAFGLVAVLAVASVAALTQIELSRPLEREREALQKPLQQRIETRSGLQQELTAEFHKFGEKKDSTTAGKMAKASIPEPGIAPSVQLQERSAEAPAEAPPAQALAARQLRTDEDLYKFPSVLEPGGGVVLASASEARGKAESRAETLGLLTCANGVARGEEQAAFLNALEIYNKAFQETGEARRTLLREALRRFEKTAAGPLDTWQVLASALCADINRSLGETPKAVDLYQGIIKNAVAYPGYVFEARYALFKVWYYDQKDIEAARLEAMAIIEEASSDPRASHVSLLMGDRLTETQPRAAAFWYRKAQEICPPNSAGYDRAGFALASLERRLADENYILDWWVIGPFEDPEDRRLVTRQPPEREIDLLKQYPGAGGRMVGWKRLSKTEPPHDRTVGELEQGKGFHFHGIVEPDEHVSLYALTYVHVDKKTPVRLFIGSDDSVRCWVNDEMMWSNPCIRGLAPDQDRVSATLRPGWNKVLLKVANNEGLWGVFFQIMGSGGQLLWDLQVDPDAGEAYRSSPAATR
jgi:tetratricopeptide (TPR) repeat protein